MDIQRRSLQIGAAAVVCAVVLRLLGGSTAALPEDLRPAQPETLPAMEYPAESPPPPVAEPEQPEAIRITRDRAEGVKLNSRISEKPDLGALAEQPLDWVLTGEEPTVLILHTHTSESYTKEAGQDYREQSPYHTMDEGYNMLRIGDTVASRLEAAGIRVIHDREFHDVPSYNGSYDHARLSTGALLEEYPGIRLILDLHRDAADTGSGQLRTHAEVNGLDSAQLMLVMGSDAGGLDYPNWRENLALAVKMQIVLEDLAPGIVRPISLRKERFNEHMSPGAVLVEVGAAGDSLTQALRAAEVLADGVIALAHGANT